MPGPRLYLDIDDVLADTTRRMARLAREQFGKQVEFDEMHVFDLGISLGLDEDELPRFMEAVHEEDFLFELDDISGASRTVARWHSSAEVHIVTGRPPETHAVTERWLARVGLPYRRLELVDKYGRYADRATLTRDDLFVRPYRIVIEDSPEIARLFVEQTDATVLLMDRPWNRAEAVEGPRLIRVHDWEAIAAHVSERVPELAHTYP